MGVTAWRSGGRLWSLYLQAHAAKGGSACARLHAVHVHLMRLRLQAKIPS
jgi:hypothetical protein